jgi:hypothetical protein
MSSLRFREDALMDLISFKWLAILGCASAWTIFFSFSNTPGLRGWRNLGWLSCYVIGLVMLFALSWLCALTTWAVFGITSGLLYFTYEVFGYWRERSQNATKPSFMTVINGLLLWPIMLPEVIEYCLADLGILKSAGKS